MKKVLLTGATGFIGRQCVASLLQKEFEIHAVTSRKETPPCGKDVTWHRVNLLVPGAAGHLMNMVRPTHLLHFAWHVVPGKWATSDTWANYYWAQASLELLRTFHETGGHRMVAAGSCTEYDWRFGFCSEERTPKRPATFYGKCKDGFRRLMEGYAGEAGMSVAWGRIFFLYGPHENQARLVSSVCRSLLNGEYARCTHGNQIRDYMYVEDVADAFVALLDSDVKGPINIASGQPVALRELVFRIADRLGKRNLVELGAIPVPEHETDFVVGDTRRLRTQLHWRPKNTLAQGIEKTIDWWADRTKRT